LRENFFRAQFSREGFTAALERLASAHPDRYRLVTPADMYG
jgi:hypothetical protein